MSGDTNTLIKLAQKIPHVSFFLDPIHFIIYFEIIIIIIIII
jgi:hypothetical protein